MALLLSSFLCTLHSLQTIFSSSKLSNDVNDSYGWNPRFDPVYDSKTKMCYFDTCSEHRFTFEQYKAMISSTKTKAIKSMSKTTFTDSDTEYEVDSSPEMAGNSRFFSYSSDSEEVLSSPELHVPSPSSQLTIKKSSSFFDSVEHLFVPTKCRGYERKWDFIKGDLLGEERTVIGWISRIGYADNFIREMGFQMISASYTLVPHRLVKDSKIFENISEYKHMEIECDGQMLFQYLYAISPKIDSYFIISIVAIDITFNKYGMASIKIFIKPGEENAIYTKLFNVYTK